MAQKGATWISSAKKVESFHDDGLEKLELEKKLIEYRY